MSLSRFLWKPKGDIVSVCGFRKHVPDYSVSRERKDLGFITFDLRSGKAVLHNTCYSTQKLPRNI